MLGVILALLPAVASSTEPSPTVDAVNQGLYGHSWSPTEVSVATGGSVTLRNSTTVPHGVRWVSGPATPVCDAGVPVGTTTAASGVEWSGSCTFSQAGTYTFYCTVHGPEMTGTVTVSTPGAPLAVTGETGGVDETGATLRGTVDRQGKATTYHFEYGKTISYGSATTAQSAAEVSGGQAVSAAVSSLTPGTTYHYRLVAENSAGTTDGADRTFTTALPPGPPSAGTGAATGLGETEARLNGTVDPDGEASTYLFEWGLTEAYGQSTAELPAGGDHVEHAESALLSGLAPGTLYHFRIVAKNAAATVTGADQTFTTPATPPPPSPVPPRAPPPSSPAPPAAQSSLAPSPPASILGGAPLGPLSIAPSLRSTQHGASVKGTLAVPPAGAGGSLEVDLLARSASIAKTRRSSAVRVGRLVRGSLPAGTVSFAVPLDARARAALRRHRKLALTVEITLTPRGGAASKAARGVVLSR
jgi:plastocyanin